MEQPPKKGPLKKLKEKVDEEEEQLVILSSFVRLGILIWSGAILTLAYVDIPKFPKQDLDPTFIASVFTGVLATFGVTPASKNSNHQKQGGLSKEEMKELMVAMQTTKPPGKEND